MAAPPVTAVDLYNKAKELHIECADSATDISIQQAGEMLRKLGPVFSIPDYLEPNFLIDPKGLLEFTEVGFRHLVAHPAFPEGRRTFRYVHMDCVVGWLIRSCCSDFVRLLSTAPWSEMLPDGVGAQLGFAMLKDLRLESSSENISVEQQFMQQAIKVFKQADLDNSGGLDQHELTQVRDSRLSTH